MAIESNVKFNFVQNMFIGWSSLLLRLGYGMLFGLLTIQEAFSLFFVISGYFLPKPIGT